MYPIEAVEPLNAEVTRMVVRAPQIARKIKPGQFIMLRIDEEGERIPLTMNEADAQTGTVTIVFQAVGATTMRLSRMKAGEALLDFVGPLGNPTELEGSRRACVIGGGLGCAIAYPQAKWLHDHGCEVDVITGFRSSDLIIFEEEMAACSSRSIVMTDDGSNGSKGVVTEPLKRWIEGGRLRSGAGCGSCDHDEVRRADHEAPRHQDARLDEPAHDRRHGHVRRMPGEGGR